ncbi:MAG: hypothetical protein JW700_00885 [Candidatus Aenigmarchaeota archaeon]|nr:hypothetical protein [Candidatus Aenigmarchaeota archaeon]
MAKRHKISREEKFESMLEKNAENVVEEMAALAQKVGIKPSKGAPNDDWGFRVFGLLGPIFSSVFGALFVIISSWLIRLVGFQLGNAFVLDVASMLSSNVHWFFALFVFFGYSDYFSKRFRKKYWIIAPFVSGTCLLFVLWLGIWVLNTTNLYSNSIFLANLSNFIYANMVNIMLVFIVLDYVLIVLEKIILIEGLNGSKKKI